MILLGSFLASMTLMFVVWLIYLVKRNAAIIDVFWSINIAMIGCINLCHSPMSSARMVVLSYLVLWSCRLAGFLFCTRSAKGKIDPRYESMSQDWQKKSLGFLAQYLLQGLFAWVIALPFYFFQLTDLLSVQFFLASLLIVIGLVGETVADHQLLNFKRTAKGGLCNIGLWRYSRHPNYFFECMVWLGFSFMGASVGWGGLSFLSIALLFCIMWFITIPMTETQSLKSTPALYQAYINQTACFFLWPPKG